MENMIRISPDKERARSLMKLALLRYGKVKIFDSKLESALIVEGYYEVIKELIIAILFIDGYKTLSHRDLIEYIKGNYSQVTTSDVNLIDQLRKLRNSIVYYGESIDPAYVRRNEIFIKKIIELLFSICNKKLE